MCGTSWISSIVTMDMTMAFALGSMLSLNLFTQTTNRVMKGLSLSVPFLNGLIVLVQIMIPHFPV